MSDKNTHTAAGSIETIIVKMPIDPPLVNGQNGESVNTRLHNIHEELIYPVCKPLGTKQLPQQSAEPGRDFERGYP